jgi:hypothetical protein
MFGWLRTLFSPKTEEVTAIVVGRTRSEDGERYTTTFQEVGGRGRIFTKTFAWYGLSGISAPKPYVDMEVTLQVDSSGKVTDAKSAA